MDQKHNEFIYILDINNYLIIFVNIFHHQIIGSSEFGQMTLGEYTSTNDYSLIPNEHIKKKYNLNIG